MMDQKFVVILAGFFLRRNTGTAMTMERFANFSDEVTEGRRNVKAEEELVHQSGSTASN